MRRGAILLAALLSLGLAGCSRAGEGNPNAPGGDAPPGTSGRGTADAGGVNQPAQPGAGLAGGMGGSSGLGMTGSFPRGTATQSAGAGAVTRGSPNRSPRSGVGTR